MRNVTLIFLIKREADKISQICLAMKKRGFGVGRWNGVGGKLNEGESIESAAIREAKEEVGVDILKMKKIAELDFYFASKEDWNQKVHTYFCEEWTGEPAESEEMSPKWFTLSEIPFAKMWPDDIFWLPKAIEGNLIKAEFTFGEGDSIQNQKVEVVQTFDAQ